MTTTKKVSTTKTETVPVRLSDFSGREIPSPRECHWHTETVMEINTQDMNGAEWVHMKLDLMPEEMSQFKKAITQLANDFARLGGQKKVAE